MKFIRFYVLYIDTFHIITKRENMSYAKVLLRKRVWLPSFVFLLLVLVNLWIWSSYHKHRTINIQAKTELSAEQAGLRLQEYIAFRITMVENLLAKNNFVKITRGHSRKDFFS